MEIFSRPTARESYHDRLSIQLDQDRRPSETVGRRGYAISYRTLICGWTPIQTKLSAEEEIRGTPSPSANGRWVLSPTGWKDWYPMLTTPR